MRSIKVVNGLPADFVNIQPGQLLALPASAVDETEVVAAAPEVAASVPTETSVRAYQELTMIMPPSGCMPAHTTMCITPPGSESLHACRLKTRFQLKAWNYGLVKAAVSSIQPRKKLNASF